MLVGILEHGTDPRPGPTYSKAQSIIKQPSAVDAGHHPSGIFGPLLCDQDGLENRFSAEEEAVG